MRGSQERRLQTRARSMSRNKKDVEASTSEQFNNDSPFYWAAHQYPAQPHSLVRPRGEPREAKCRPIPLEKGAVEKKANRHEIPKMISAATIRGNPCQRNENIASMIATMEAMMKKLKASGRGPVLGASTTTTPTLVDILREHFHHFRNSQTLGAWWLPLDLWRRGRQPPIPVFNIRIRKHSDKYSWSLGTTQRAPECHDVSFQPKSDCLHCGYD